MKIKATLLAALAAFSLSACGEQEPKVVYLDSETGTEVAPPPPPPPPLPTAKAITLDHFDYYYCNGGIVFGVNDWGHGAYSMPIIQHSWDRGDLTNIKYKRCDMTTGEMI